MKRECILKRPKIAIAGITGFIGHEIAKALEPHHDLIGLSRGSCPADLKDKVVDWRVCDLFSLKDSEEALKGVDVAIYLVHSMMPQARLTQASFEDLDLICADNFARACRDHGVKRILYLGGLIPQTKDLSAHLKSRLEVEQVLSSYGIPLTSLRAGLILGGQGSSFQMMVKLVKRLPFMVCPAWTLSLTQPVAVDDVVSSFVYAIEHPDSLTTIYDLGGPDQLSYLQMMKKTAAVLNKSFKHIVFPYFTPKLSRIWVSVVTGTPWQLALPLIESLKHQMVVTHTNLVQVAVKSPLNFESAIKRALAQFIIIQKRKKGSFFKRIFKSRRDVRSVQRLSKPVSRDAWWVAYEYLKWLPTYKKLFFKVVVDQKGQASFYLRFFPWKLLELTLSVERSKKDRPIFYITGGLLNSSAPKARFEFREVLDGKTVLAAIHDFQPKLPWFLYVRTQAIVHLWVMKAFAKHLAHQ